MKGERKEKPLSKFASRLKAALADGYVKLHVLESELFSPAAHRNAVQGGPPGCRWVLVRELKRHRVPISAMNGDCTANQVAGPWPGTSVPVEVITKPRLNVPWRWS